jgi:hypothetical protein
MVAEISLFPPDSAGRFLLHVFHRQWESLAENSDRFA